MYDGENVWCKMMAKMSKNHECDHKTWNVNVLEMKLLDHVLWLAKIQIYNISETRIFLNTYKTWAKGLAMLNRGTARIWTLDPEIHKEFRQICAPSFDKTRGKNSGMKCWKLVGNKICNGQLSLKKAEKRTR